MISYRPYKNGDAFLFSPKDIFSDDKNLSNRVDDCGSTGSPTLTILNGDVIVGVVGGTMIWDGVLDVWAMFSDDVLEIPISFHRSLKKIIDGLISSSAIHRLQMSVRLDFSQGRRWARLLGFMPEGVMKSYGPEGGDYVLYARLL